MGVSVVETQNAARNPHAPRHDHGGLIGDDLPCCAHGNPPVSSGGRRLCDGRLGRRRLFSVSHCRSHLSFSAYRRRLSFCSLCHRHRGCSLAVGPALRIFRLCHGSRRVVRSLYRARGDPEHRGDYGTYRHPRDRRVSWMN